MKFKAIFLYSGLSLIAGMVSIIAAAREVTFCGEQIPVNNSFVATKLMNVIRQQIPYANLPSLRRKAKQWFPYIEYCLRASGMPQDLKYIPIVESGFSNATSRVGAQGFWQFMPSTAVGYGLQVTASRDDRNDPYKATIAALRKLASDYKSIQRRYNVSSWALTAAAYNCGLGCVYKKMKTEGGNYFTMSLNAETALYVYKIIAIKELFEYPELYMKNFRHNVFNTIASEGGNQPNLGDNKADFQNVDVVVRKDETAAPDDSKIENVSAPTEADLEVKEDASFSTAAKLVGAEIVGKYPHFKDGDPVTIKLQEDLQTLSGFQRRSSLITGKGWLIEDRVHIDLGFDSNNVILYDTAGKQGVAKPSLKNNEQVILKVQN